MDYHNDDLRKLLEGKIASELSVSLTDNGAILIRIPSSTLEKVRAIESKEPISESFKTASTTHVVEGFKFSDAAIVSDRDGRHLEIFMTQPRYLHLWFETNQPIDVERYEISGNISEAYEEVFASNKRDVHTFVWDSNILQGDTLEIESKKNGISWEDVFIHYNTYDDNDNLVKRVDTFNLWLADNIKIDKYHTNLERLQMFITTTIRDNFLKLREKGRFIPQRTLNIKKENEEKKGTF